MKTDAIAPQPVHALLSPTGLDLLRGAAHALGLSVEIWNTPGRCTERIALGPACARCEVDEPRIFDRCRKRRSYLTRREAPVPAELAERCPLKLRLARRGPASGHAGPTVFAFGYTSTAEPAIDVDASVQSFLHDLQHWIQLGPEAVEPGENGTSDVEPSQLLAAIAPRLSPEIDARSLRVLEAWCSAVQARCAFVWQRDSGLWGMTWAERPAPSLQRELRRRGPILARRLHEALERGGKTRATEKLGSEHPIARALGAATDCLVVPLVDAEVHGVVAGLRPAQATPVEPRSLENLTVQLGLSLAHAAERRRAEACWTRTLGALVAAMDARAVDQHGHSQRVHALSMLLGRRLGLDHDALETLHWAALLHDIGKIARSGSDHTPAPPAASRPGEHARCGYQMIQGIEELQRAATAVHHHHEHWDGSGGPDGLRGSTIPAESRIIAVADAFDVLTSREGCSLEAAARQIESESGSRFDPETARALQGLLPVLNAHPWVLLAGTPAPTGS